MGKYHPIRHRREMPPMTEPTRLWPTWQVFHQRFAQAFTRRGFRRLAERVTAPVLNVEEHTVTQPVLAIEWADDWKASGIGITSFLH